MRTIIAKVGGRGESPFFKGVVTLGTVENTVDKEALDLESEGWYLKQIYHSPAMGLQQALTPFKPRFLLQKQNKKHPSYRIIETIKYNSTHKSISLTVFNIFN